MIIPYASVRSSLRKVHVVHLFCQKFTFYDKPLNIQTIAFGQGRLTLNLTSIQHINSHINQKQLEFHDFRIKSRAKYTISLKKLFFLKYAVILRENDKKYKNIPYLHEIVAPLRHSQKW